MSRLRCAALALLVGLPAVSSAQDPTDERIPHVQTVGRAERRIAPDRATLILLIETRGSTAAQAGTLNARRTEEVRDTLRSAGIAVAPTASYTVQPDYERPTGGRGSEEGRVSGYRAHTRLRVDLTQIERIGQILDAALAAGASGVETVFFESSRADSVRRAAMAEASTAARADAEVLARAMGGSLGSLLSVNSGGDGPIRASYARIVGYGRGSGGGGGAGIGGAAGTAIAPDELVVVATVFARWRFVSSR